MPKVSWFVAGSFSKKLVETSKKTSRGTLKAELNLKVGLKREFKLEGGVAMFCRACYF